MNFESEIKNRHSFTLIELLIVLAIVAILSVVVILTLNPSELLKQARDSNRLSDLSNLNSALGVFNTDVPGGFMGTSSIVYVSIADTISTCANLGLPTLPTGWSYNCATQANLKKNDGTGWIPVNFKQITFGSPLSNLPIDPQNTTTTAYYTYVTGGSWQLASRLESQKYASKAISTNNYDPGLYVLGSNTNLAPFVGGLVGWWKFDDNNNSTTTDSSGYGNTGTWNGTSTSRYVAGKVGAYAGYFNGQSDYVDTGVSSVLGFTNSFSASAWVKQISGDSSVYRALFGKYSPYGWDTLLTSGMSRMEANGSSTINTSGVGPDIRDGTWHNFVWVVTPSYVDSYADGALIARTTGTWTSVVSSNSFQIGARNGSLLQYGSMDDVRIYNRALSAAEVAALYNSTK